MAHEMIELAKAYAFAAAREAAEKQAARTQRVQKHEAKQRRRAALQSAEARLKDAETGATSEERAIAAAGLEQARRFSWRTAAGAVLRLYEGIS